MDSVVYLLINRKNNPHHISEEMSERREKSGKLSYDSDMYSFAECNVGSGVSR